MDAFDPDQLDDNGTDGIRPPKSNRALPIDESPYTGYPVTGGTIFGFGGVAITPRTVVLDTRDEPTPGLYVAGNATGGLSYDDYVTCSIVISGRLYSDGENSAKPASFVRSVGSRSR